MHKTEFTAKNIQTVKHFYRFLFTKTSLKYSSQLKNVIMFKYLDFL